MIIRKSFQYRLNPTKKQARSLDKQLGEVGGFTTSF
ncbi:MAG: helix-turn-helix domain-containing protein [Simkania sp.]|nr:helix-turn-helix domain-containing protein [Simkania sp.]